jgi:hypothetical protein
VTLAGSDLLRYVRVTALAGKRDGIDCMAAQPIPTVRRLASCLHVAYPTSMIFATKIGLVSEKCQGSGRPAQQR